MMVCEQRLFLGQFFSAPDDRWLSFHFYSSCLEKEQEGCRRPTIEARASVARLLLLQGGRDTHGKIAAVRLGQHTRLILLIPPPPQVSWSRGSCRQSCVSSRLPRADCWTSLAGLSGSGPTKLCGGFTASSLTCHWKQGTTAKPSRCSWKPTAWRRSVHFKKSLYLCTKYTICTYKVTVYRCKTYTKTCSL